MWHLYEVLINIFENSLFYYTVYRVAGFRAGKRILRILYFCIIVGVESFLNFWQASSTLTMPLMCSLTIVFALVFGAQSRAERIFSAVLYIVAAAAASLSISFIMFLLFPHQLPDALTLGPLRVVPTLAYVGLCALLLLGLTSRMRGAFALPQRFLGPFAISWLLIMVASGSLEMILTTIEDSLDDSAKFSLSLTFLLFSFFLLWTTFLIYKLGEYYQTAVKTETDVAVLKERKKETESKEVFMRRWIHDQRHHLNTLTQFARSGDLKSIEEYLGQMNVAFEVTVPMNRTGNRVIDTVLGVQAAEAQQDGITMRIHTCPIEDSIDSITDIELSSILNNALENAREACLRCAPSSDRRILVRFDRMPGMIDIVVENSSNGIYQSKNGNLLSSKFGRSHGIGLQQIQSIVETAGGWINVDAQAEYFRIEIALPTQNNGKRKERRTHSKGED